MRRHPEAGRPGRLSPHPETRAQSVVDHGFHAPVATAHFPPEQPLDIRFQSQCRSHGGIVMRAMIDGKMLPVRSVSSAQTGCCRIGSLRQPARAKGRGGRLFQGTVDGDAAGPRFAVRRVIPGGRASTARSTPAGSAPPRRPRSRRGRAVPPPATPPPLPCPSPDPAHQAARRWPSRHSPRHARASGSPQGATGTSEAAIVGIAASAMPGFSRRPAAAAEQAQQRGRRHPGRQPQQRQRPEPPPSAHCRPIISRRPRRARHAAAPASAASRVRGRSEAAGSGRGCTPRLAATERCPWAAGSGRAGRRSCSATAARARRACAACGRSRRSGGRPVAA